MCRPSAKPTARCATRMAATCWATCGASTCRRPAPATRRRTVATLFGLRRPSRSRSPRRPELLYRGRQARHPGRHRPPAGHQRLRQFATAVVLCHRRRGHAVTNRASQHGWSQQTYTAAHRPDSPPTPSTGAATAAGTSTCRPASRSTPPDRRLRRAGLRQQHQRRLGLLGQRPTCTWSTSVPARSSSAPPSSARLISKNSNSSRVITLLRGQRPEDRRRRPECSTATLVITRNQPLGPTILPGKNAWIEIRR